jgi:hypothetical protein
MGGYDAAQPWRLMMKVVMPRIPNQLGDYTLGYN